MKQNLESRMRAIEMTCRGTGDKFFVVWGRDATAIEAAISVAKRAGTIMPGDITVRGVWPKDAPGEPPAPRWASVKEVSDAEVGLLACQLGVFPDAPSQPGDDKARYYSDAELFGTAFGQPVAA